MSATSRTALIYTDSLSRPTGDAMSVREFRAPDGRQWRVWDVRPNEEAAERRRSDRRVTPIESLDDPPVLERRHSADRRTPGGTRPRMRPGDLLPDRWRDGWLVYEDVSGTGHETRRLAPIPPQWESLSEAELAARLDQAVVSKRLLS
ncbi:hypothetical protein J421_0714 [Gemmatirosa kalamazoonensis]|uniref:Uncharacterized protein n=2 Tax=Gemmatirosa kalamazoonensis TaxID=861299 RepID=W0RBU6_9BACT|nr:hypothetical protein J421_0714 [Gemmatirosa kalamazoonensis]